MGPGEQVVLRRLLQPGEQVPVTAAPLLRVTVGDVTGVTVLVRGSPFDLGPIARGPVARFEVQ
jgi:cytoskeleton protein RodZ